MSLLPTDTLLVEQPWTAFSLLWRPKYRADVYDGRDLPIAIVREGRGPGLLTPLRLTGFSGWTPFDLRVTAPNGQPLLNIRKGIGRRVDVTAPNGQALGSVRRFALLDPSGRQICQLGDVAHVNTRQLTKRNGRRVRRDVVRIRPGVAEPLRSLAIAAGVAFDVVHGKGTSHVGGGGDWPAG
ncbi:hypothetical protein Lesp02_54140 [Lentzea sp. NBRC 105346]|uniref:hypothetical protein n=1 Tax=Lentzea sp. NBRC 105346 TaxID=3032205 RepID=UPI0024A31236|nr:hypothetical protein [Lentzea sp. NBRC 105346]GLZ33226.1 hypothetical protein Lesp02_54140 [Lentzea sp. NBRC 105346]